MSDANAAILSALEAALDLVLDVLTGAQEVEHEPTLAEASLVLLVALRRQGFGVRAVSDPCADDLVKHMVDRFLGWKLPSDFRPDAGIKFDANEPLSWDPRNRPHEPYGTNLFDYAQTQAMVRHMLEGLPAPALSELTPGG